MVKVVVSNAKGLVQEAGNGVDVQNDLNINGTVTMSGSDNRFPGDVRFFSGSDGTRVQYGVPNTAEAGTEALLAAAVKHGIVDCTPGAARDKATDTAANFISGLGLDQVGDTFDFYFINKSTTALRRVVLTAGSNVTLVGNMVIPPNSGSDKWSASSAHFRIRRSGANACHLYRLC